MYWLLLYCVMHICSALILPLKHAEMQKPNDNLHHFINVSILCSLKTT